MDFPEAQELMLFWADNPPVRVIIAHYLGYRQPAATTTNEIEERMLSQAPTRSFESIPAVIQEAIRKQQQQAALEKDQPNAG